MNDARVWEQIAISIVRDWVGDGGEVIDETAGNCPDFRIHYADGRSAIGEVSWATNQQVREQWGLVLQQKWPEIVELPNSRGSWVVQLSAEVRIKKFLQEIGSLVDHLGSLGVCRLEIYSGWPRDEAAEWARSLGVKRIERIEGDRDQVRYVLSGIGVVGTPEPNLVAEWVGEFLKQPDKLDICDKLRPFADAEKHVFLIVGAAASYEVQTLTQHFHGALPTADPQLPPWVSHLWLFPEWTLEESLGSGMWSQERSWSYVSK